MGSWTVTLLTTAVVCTVEAAQIPEYFKLCSRSDPDVDSCLKSSLKAIIPQLIDGDRRLGIYPLDPWYVPEMSFTYQRGPITSKVVAKNSNTYGIKNIDIRYARVNFDKEGNMHLEVDVKYPFIDIVGDYKFDGRVAMFPMYGKGPFNVSMSDVSVTWMIDGKPIKKGGKTYMKIEHFNMRPQLSSFKMYAGNLFDGDKALGDTFLSLANEFWEIMYMEMLPYLQESWDILMTDVANKIFLKVPFDEIFPEK